MRILKLLALATLTAIAAPSSGDAAAPQPLSDPHGHWRLRPQYSDEFNGETLDTTKWTSHVPRRGTLTWDPDNVWLRNGHLVLQMTYQPHMYHGKQEYYLSSSIESINPPLKYGYFEARIKGVDRFPGVAPAYWLSNAAQAPSPWTEIDIVEMQGAYREAQRNRIDFTAHEWRIPGLDMPPQHIHLPSLYPDWNPASSYHVYGLSWNAEELKWYVDGQLAAELRNSYFDQPLNILFCLGIRYPLPTDPDATGFPTTMSVDYVRVWSPE